MSEPLLLSLLEFTKLPPGAMYDWYERLPVASEFWSVIILVSPDDLDMRTWSLPCAEVVEARPIPNVPVVSKAMLPAPYGVELIAVLKSIGTVRIPPPPPVIEVM